MKQYNGKKRLIQSYFYNKITNNTSFVGLAGNNLDLHITDINLVIGKCKRNKAYIYDLDANVIDKFKALETPRINLINTNILNCRIERFIDLDLMDTLSTIQGIVYHIFNQQYIKYSNSNYKNNTINTFMFTYSLRNNKRDLNKFLICLFEDKPKLNIVNIECKTYRDSCPMCTVQIQYN